MHCGDCPGDDAGTLSEYCEALGLWTEEGEVEAPCVSERMMTCPWCGSDVIEDYCEHQAVISPEEFEACPVEPDGDRYWMAYEPMSAAGNSSVTFLFLFEDKEAVKKIRAWVKSN